MLDCYSEKGVKLHLHITPLFDSFVNDPSTRSYVIALYESRF
jgi:hypothetical protein